jgi:LPXTG-motif cell wall-anchored protein
MGKSRSSAYLFAAAYITVVVGLFLALGGAAYAQSPSSASDQYGTKVKGVKVSATAGGDTASAEAAQAEALPNTGLSLLGVVVVGGALVGGGLLLRRREQRKS